MARLMRLKELKRGVQCWIEINDGPMHTMLAEVFVNSIEKGRDSLHGWFKCYDMFIPREDGGTFYRYEYTYNSTWRCWTYRPTYEQMKEAKWDDA